MSAVASVERLRQEQPLRRGFPSEARTYLVAAVAVASLAAVASSVLDRGPVPWTDFALILVGGALAQAFAVHIPGNRVFHTGLAFTVMAALVLPPEGLVAVCVVQHIPEWFRRRYPWYIQTFNIANFALSGLAAWATYEFAEREWPAAGGRGTAGVLAAMSAGAVFVLMNHALLARMLKLARGRQTKDTRLFTIDELIADLVLAAIGIGMAFALDSSAALALVVALPLILIHRALVVPSLREQALRDHKTGLLNTRGFEKGAEQELARARRFARPLSLLMVDIDEFRHINNCYGHLAGDDALVALADTFRAELRDYDLCARFGGDEFLIVLPETELDESLAIAARIQERIAASPFFTHHREHVSVTVSIGAAERHPEDSGVGDLISRADAALYAGKRASSSALA